MPDGELRCRLFDGVTIWFINRYGDRAIWDGILGRIPVILRGDVYLVQVPYVTGDTLVKLTDRFEELPQKIAEEFTSHEFEELGGKIGAGSEAFYSLYNLHLDDHILDDAERGMVQRALFDFEHSATSLKRSGDTQNSIFHSHAAAEKFLKVALKRATRKHSLKKLGHNLPLIFSRLVQAQKRYEWLRKSVDALDAYAPNMEIRYSEIGRSAQDAIISFNAALSIAGTLAGMWLFDQERGSSDARFVPGRFYVDSARRTYFCTRFKDSNTACLRLFIMTPPAGGIMADML
jgi:HEPN domain-containing protein